MTATSVVLPASGEAVAGPRRLAAPLWVGALLIVLAFLVIYPLLMLVFGALSDSNPVVDGFGAFRPSAKHFLDVLANENVHLAFINALVACGGGTVLAVAIGLAFSWIVVRTNTPARGFIAGASMIPLFVPPLVAGVAWGILGSPKTGLLNTALKWLDIDFQRFEISVTRSIVFQVVGPCKTEASQKPVPLDSRLAEALRVWRDHTKYSKPEDWVFAL